MYSKVIVPLDGSELSEQALPFCQLVARSMSVPIELVEAYDILPPAVHDRHTSQVVSEMLSDARQRSGIYLASIRERLETAGNAASVSMLYGAPADAIVALASADPEALVVMSTHGRGGIVRWARPRQCCPPGAGGHFAEDGAGAIGRVRPCGTVPAPRRRHGRSIDRPHIAAAGDANCRLLSPSPGRSDSPDGRRGGPRPFVGR